MVVTITVIITWATLARVRRSTGLGLIEPGADMPQTEQDRAAPERIGAG